MNYISKIKRVSKSERGTSLVEFGVLVGVISIGAIASVLVTGDEISKSFFSSQKTIGEKIDIAKKGGAGGGGAGEGGGSGSPSKDPSAFIVKFDTTDADPNKRKAPLALFGAVNATIDWGGPSSSCPTTVSSAGVVECVYDTPGVYTASITGLVGQFGNGWNVVQNTSNLIAVLQWGDVGIVSLSGAFAGNHGLQSLPNELPAGIQNTSYMFQMSNANPTLGSNWDLSSVDDALSMFNAAQNFNQDISGWKFGPGLQSVSQMFRDAKAFNQDISGWNLSYNSWMNAGDMFNGATAFDKDISNWCFGWEPPNFATGSLIDGTAKVPSYAGGCS